MRSLLFLMHINNLTEVVYLEIKLFLTFFNLFDQSVKMSNRTLCSQEVGKGLKNLKIPRNVQYIFKKCNPLKQSNATVTPCWLGRCLKYVGVIGT